MNKFWLAILVLLAGCHRTSEQYINPVLQDQAFLQGLKELNITLVAPSSGLSVKELDALKSLLSGKVKFLPDQHYLKPNPWTNATAKQTADEITQAMESGGILWAVRGGYGARRLASILSKRRIKSSATILVGYSDVTALHLLFSARKQKVCCIHAPVARELIQEGHDCDGFRLFMGVLSGQIKQIKVNLQPLNANAKKTSKLHGPLTGGNLTLVEASIGAVWQADCKDKILFLEDVGCNPGQVIGSLAHLEDSGLLDGVKAVVFGRFSKEDDREFIPILFEFADRASFPVFLTDKIGHGYHNYPIGCGCPGAIEHDVEKPDSFILRVDFSKIPLFKKNPYARNRNRHSVKR
ncbi:MAG: LD-carboxypeptidase [Holosporales bacterium]|jgi:muramoyltetrapeptide carboxypeptidase|nr:LD-carboxypeptidase [Holosporales bacterium]